MLWIFTLSLLWWVNISFLLIIKQIQPWACGCDCSFWLYSGAKPWGSSERPQGNCGSLMVSPSSTLLSFVFWSLDLRGKSTYQKEDTLFLKLDPQGNVNEPFFSFSLDLTKVIQFSSVTQSCQILCNLSITNFRSLLKLMSIELVMPSNHLFLIVPFSSCLQSFPASGSFPVSQFFTSGSQRIGVSASASVLPMIIQDWFPLG